MRLRDRVVALVDCVILLGGICVGFFGINEFFFPIANPPYDFARVNASRETKGCGLVSRVWESIIVSNRSHDKDFLLLILQANGIHIGKSYADLDMIDPHLACYNVSGPVHFLGWGGRERWFINFPWWTENRSLVDGSSNVVRWNVSHVCQQHDYLSIRKVDVANFNCQICSLADFQRVSRHISSVLLRFRLPLHLFQRILELLFAFVEDDGGLMSSRDHFPQLECRNRGISHDNQKSEYLYIKFPSFMDQLACGFGFILIFFGMWNLKFGPQNGWGILMFVGGVSSFFFGLYLSLERLINSI